MSRMRVIGLTTRDGPATATWAEWDTAKNPLSGPQALRQEAAYRPGVLFAVEHLEASTGLWRRFLWGGEMIRREGEQALAADQAGLRAGGILKRAKRRASRPAGRDAGYATGPTPLFNGGHADDELDGGDDYGAGDEAADPVGPDD